MAYRLKTLDDIRRFLARVINLVDADKMDSTKGRALGYLCNTAATVIKDSEIESRIAALETRLNDTVRTN